MKAYVLIQTETNVKPIAWELKDIPGVMTAEDLAGPYDAIVTVGMDRRPFDAILDDIRSIPGVARAVTAPLIDSRKKAHGTEAA